MMEELIEMSIKNNKDLQKVVKQQHNEILRRCNRFELYWITLLIVGCFVSGFVMAFIIYVGD